MGKGDTQRRGKASELVDHLLAHPLTPEEMEKRQGGKRPELRLRQEALGQALDADAPVRDVLGRLGSEAVTSAVLHDPESGATAIAVPLDRYLQLVNADIADRQLTEVTLDGRFMAPADVLEAAGVEQVDPEAAWFQAPDQTWA